MTLCGVGILGITPFAILRFAQQQWLLGAIDAALVVGVFVIGLHVWKTRKVRMPSIVLTIFYISGTITAIYVSECQLIYWAFPATIAVYFLLKPNEAAVVNVISILILIPAMSMYMQPLEMSTLLVTLVLNNIFSYIFARSMQINRQMLEQQATRDSLTGAANRRLFDEKINGYLTLKKRHQESTVLIMLDIDYFKAINDKFGHMKGDDVLIGLVDTLRTRLRESDGLYRLGGEEFAILLNKTEIQQALKLAEELRQLVENAVLLPDTTVTISLGLAECREDDSRESWIERTDTALYQAKSEGRNRTCLEKHRVHPAPLKVLSSS